MRRSVDVAVAQTRPPASFKSASAKAARRPMDCRRPSARSGPVEFSVLPPENATGNFTKIVQRVLVRIRLDGDAAALGRLRPGLSVAASVDRRTGTGADENAPSPP